MTKQLILFCFLFQLCLNSTSQTIQKLDEKYGLNKFKLESPYSLLKSKLIPANFNGDGNLQYYIYIGTDIKSIFGYGIKKIELAYYKSKLYYIGFKFDTNDVIFNKDIVYRNLRALFGEGDFNDYYKTGPLEYDWGYHWKGKKTYLSFDKSNDGVITLWIQSEKIARQILNDEI